MKADERMGAAELATGLVDRLGDGVISVALYGSAAGERFREGRSDLNVIVVMREIGELELRRCATLAREWTESGNPPPLLLTRSELHRSLDIFPIEYLEIREAHRVLHGDDPFVDLVIDPEHLRLQCERELKTSLIQLRERYLLSARDPTEIGELWRASISSYLVHYRTILRLVRETIPDGDEVVVRRVAELAGFDPAPLLAVLRSRDTAEPFLVPAGEAVAAGYLAAAARVVEFVDGLSSAG